MRKRILSMMLAMVLVLGLVPAAFAAEMETERGTLTYTEAIQPQYEEAGRFADNGLAAVKKNGKWGYIDTSGKTIIPFRYEMAFIFHEGRALVCTEATAEYEWIEGTYYDVGFIDEKGNYTPFIEFGERVQLLAGQYDTNDLYFHNGFVLFIPVSDIRDFAHLYATDGTALDLGGWMPDGRLNEGLIPAVEDGTWRVGWVDTSGNIIKDFSTDWDEETPVYISRVLPFNQGLAPVWQATWDPETGETSYLLGFMDRGFQWVVRPQFTDYIYSNSRTTYQLFGTTGLAMVQKDGKYGAIDKTGKTVIPFQYDELWPISAGMMVFKENGKYGYLDADTLAVAIPAQFERASSFGELGLAVVTDGTKTYLIDKQGSAVPGANKLDASTYFIDYEDGTWAVNEPEEYVVIQKNGSYGYGRIEYLTTLPAVGEMDSWAYDLVVTSIKENLVPATLQNLYQNDITRGEFCDLVIQTIETALGKEISDVVKEQTGKGLSAYQAAYPFTDSTDYNVIAANALGIVSGRGNGIFDPYASITRQEAAAMLTRVAQVLGADTANAPSADFSDGTSVASYFVNAVNFVYQNNIMGGTGDNSFTPLGTYTREQSYITVYRLVQAVLREDEADPEPVAPIEPETDPEPAAPAATLANGKPITDDNIREILYSLKSSYPEGMHWTNEDNSYYSSTLGNGGGCAAFAFLCSDTVFGTLPRSGIYSDFDSIRVGDILRVNYNTHSVVVLEKRENSVVVTEGNYNSSVHWGREISRQSLEKGEFYGQTRYPA